MLSETIRATAPLHICGIQSNDEDLDSSYASSMFYDAESHRVFVTGATYGRYFDPGAIYSDDDDTTDCFVGILQLPMRDEQSDPVWLRRVTIGEPNVSEACSDIVTGGQNTSRAIYLAGHTEKSPGILASLYPDLANNDPSTSPAVYGMILDLTWSAKLKGGRLIYADTMQYPVAITSDSGMDDIFVATSTANTTAIDPAFSMWAEQQNITQIDSTAAERYLPPYYGRGFAASVQKLNTIGDVSNIRQVMGGGTYSLQENLKAAWDLQVGQDGAPDGFSVHISSLLHLSDKVLVLAGSTRGAGPSFGGIDDDLSMDGFLTVLDPGTGDVVQSKRVQSSNSSTDKILGLCHSNHNSSNYDIFVVGMTDGNMYSEGQIPASPVQTGVYQAFIQKVNIVSLEVLWTYQLGAYLEEDEELSDDYLPHIHGMSCAVTPDGEQVYLAGTAENGATVNIDGSEATSSAGKDDIFVAQLQSSNGEVAWIKQMGTKEDDSLAHGRGILCDKDGHAILLGNTRGSFLQEKAPERVGNTNDMMLITVDRATGECMEPIDSNTSFTANVSYQILESQVNEEGIAEAQVNEESIAETQDSGLQLENKPDVDPLLPQSDSPSNSTGQPTVQVITEYMYKSNDTALIIALILLLQVVVVGLVMLVYIRCKKRGRKRRVGTQFNYRDSPGGSDETQSSTGRSSIYQDAKNNSIYQEAKSNSIYHQEEDFDDASYMSGITLRPMPGHGKIDTGRDTLLRLEPTVEPYSFNRNTLFGQRINAYKDAYNSLYADSRCMSTAGAEGSDRDQKERQSVRDDDTTSESEIHSCDSFLDGLLHDISVV
jgi:hypothetical protein